MDIPPVPLCHMKSPGPHRSDSYVSTSNTSIMNSYIPPWTMKLHNKKVVMPDVNWIINKWTHLLMIQWKPNPSYFKFSPFSPVHRALKFSAVLGTALLYSNITILPTLHKINSADDRTYDHLWQNFRVHTDSLTCSHTFVRTTPSLDGIHRDKLGICWSRSKLWVHNKTQDPQGWWWW